MFDEDNSLLSLGATKKDDDELASFFSGIANQGQTTQQNNQVNDLFGGSTNPFGGSAGGAGGGQSSLFNEDDILASLGSESNAMHNNPFQTTSSGLGSAPVSLAAPQASRHQVTTSEESPYSGFDSIFQATAKAAANQFVTTAVNTAVSSAVSGAMYQPQASSQATPLNLQGFGSEDLQREEDAASGVYGAGLRAATSMASYGYGLFQSYSTKKADEDTANSLEQNGLGQEAISNERVPTFFERWVFDSYKYQVYFNASTTEITEKMFDAIWPFLPGGQPDGLVLEYSAFCKRVFGDQYSYDAVAQQAAEAPAPEVMNYAAKDGKPVHNPFMKDENSDLSFLSRNADELDDGSIKAFERYGEKQTIKAHQYKKDRDELYGPVWIFVTLIVEFVILGHLANVYQNHLKTRDQNLGARNAEFVLLLTQRNADQTLKRLTKTVFWVGLFYFGNPLLSYIMFQKRNAFEVSYIGQLGIFSYSFAMFIPFSVLLFAVQRYNRAKYLLLLIMWLIQVFFLHKELYEIRRKYNFDFSSNKQFAWFIGVSTFLFMWMYKSYFMQI